MPESRTSFQREVCGSLHVGPPTLTADTTIFVKWLGTWSIHQGPAIPVV